MKTHLPSIEISDRGGGGQVRGRPCVGNGLWVVPLADPDGYRIEFSSPTDAPEESELKEAIVLTQ